MIVFPPPLALGLIFNTHSVKKIRIERITCVDNRNPCLTQGTASTGADLSVQNLRDEYVGHLLCRIICVDKMLVFRLSFGIVFRGRLLEG